MAFVSLTDGVAGAAVEDQMVQGHWTVVKVHVTGVMVLPAASWAPLTVAVYAVPCASAADGVKVAVRDGPSYVVVPGTTVPLPSLRTNEILLAVTVSLNVVVTVVEGSTRVAFAAGDCFVTVGAAVSTDVGLKTMS